MAILLAGKPSAGVSRRIRATQEFGFQCIAHYFSDKLLEKKLPATQVVEYAPWEIPVEALDSEEIQNIVASVVRQTD